MSFVRSALVAAVLAFVAGTASAQFVKGNEAVKVMPDGTKKVETVDAHPELTRCARSILTHP